MRSALIVIGVLALVLASRATIRTPQEANDQMCGSWTWAAGIALIGADLGLPIPQTAVIAALGIIYGGLSHWPILSSDSGTQPMAAARDINALPVQTGSVRERESVKIAPT